MPNAAMVCRASCNFFSSRAPKYWDRVTDAPANIDVNTIVTMYITVVADPPIAASPAFPTNRPTITASAKL